MANRTVKFMGYSSTPSVGVSFTFNGAEVFNGDVSSNGELDSLFTFEVDQTLSGAVSGTVSVTGGDLTVVGLSANYSMHPVDASTDDEGKTYPAVTSDDVVNIYEMFDAGANTSKSNISIDGVAYDKGDIDSSDTGSWHIELSDGNSMECDYTVEATPIPVGDGDATT